VCTTGSTLKLRGMHQKYLHPDKSQRPGGTTRPSGESRGYDDTHSQSRQSFLQSAGQFACTQRLVCLRAFSRRNTVMRSRAVRTVGLYVRLPAARRYEWPICSRYSALQRWASRSHKSWSSQYLRLSSKAPISESTFLRKTTPEVPMKFALRRPRSSSLRGNQAPGVVDCNNHL
jgi:hypothetical protein